MKISLTTKLLAPWLISILIIISGAVVLYNYVADVERELTDHNEAHRRAVELSKDVLFLSQERWAIALQYVSSQTPETAKLLSDSEQRTLQKINQLKVLFTHHNLDARHSSVHQDWIVLESYIHVRSGHGQLYSELIKAIDAHNLVLQKQKIGELVQKMRLVRAALDDLSIYHIKAQEVALLSAKSETSRIEVLFLSGITGLLLIVLAFTIYQAIEVVRPLRRLTEAAKSIESGHGDIGQLVELARSDEIGTLNRAFAAMVKQLQKYIDELSMRQTEILEQMAAMAHIGGWELDLPSMKLSWTREVYRIHEVDPSVSPSLAEGIKFYAPEARPIIQAAVEKAIADGSPWDLELPFITAKGKHLWVRAQGNAHQVKGKTVRINGSFHDITARKNATEAILQANADLESFSYSISHDMRTPLRAIDGFSRILLEDYNDKLDDEGRRLLNVVRSSTVRMAQLIDDILHLSRAGRTELRLSVVNMVELVQQVLEEQKSFIGSRVIEITVEPMPNVMGDKALLHQVFENLISNAIKFTQPIATAKIQVTSRLENNEIIISVTDNGVGFDMQYASKLFGVFQRLHGISEFEGTGIGLAIAKRIVTRHGGRIWAEASLGEGATFSFALPNKEIGYE